MRLKKITQAITRKIVTICTLSNAFAAMLKIVFLAEKSNLFFVGSYPTSKNN